jgi:hypothetical protein
MRMGTGWEGGMGKAEPGMGMAGYPCIYIFFVSIKHKIYVFY